MIVIGNHDSKIVLINYLTTKLYNYFIKPQKILKGLSTNEKCLWLPTKVKCKKRLKVYFALYQLNIKMNLHDIIYLPNHGFVYNTT